MVGLDIMRREKLQVSNNDEEIEVIDQVMDSCKIAVTILDDLLAYEKVSAGALVLDKAEVNVVNFIRTAAALFNIQAHGKSITLSVLEGEKSLPENVYFNVDFGKMTQVLRNYISNAIKFTPENGTVKIIAFERRTSLPIGDSERVVIQVIDSGVGMTKEQLGRIFNDIVQYNANALQGGGGSGIGLWVSKKIVDIHGGKVAVMSEGPGKGCIFEVDLPMTRRLARSIDKIHPDAELMVKKASAKHIVKRMIRSQPEEGMSVKHRSGFNVPLFRNMRVLVVDDSRVNRKFMTKLLSPTPYVFDEAEDGLVCLQKVEESEKEGNVAFDLILMDVCFYLH